MTWLSRKIAGIQADPARRPEYDRMAEKIRYEEERATRGWKRVERGWWNNDDQEQSIFQERDNKWYVYSELTTDVDAFKTLKAAIVFADALYDKEERP